MKSSVIKLSFFFVILLLVKSNTPFAQNHAAAFAAADSTRFSVNNNGGWDLFNSYVAPYKTDSAQIELIVQHANTVNWAQEQYVGKIKHGPLKPGSNQNINVNIFGGGYMLRIEINGKCYLRFVNGTLPAANPAVFMVKAYYKL
jgi:hypothetical protein